MKEIIKLKYDKSFCSNCPQPPFSHESKRICPYFDKIIAELKKNGLMERVDYVSCCKKDIFTHEMTYRINHDAPEHCSDIELFWKREGTIGFRNCYLVINVKKGDEKERMDELVQLLK